MKIFLLAVFVFGSVSLFAQEDEKPFHFGIGTALSLPLGDLKTGTSFGIGLEIQPSYAFTENIEGFLQAGVHVFKAKSDYGGDEENLLHIPLLVGARYKAGHFFAGAGIGYGLWTASGESNNGFMYSPQVGYAADKYEIGANYSSTSVTGGSLSYFGIKLFRKF